jgi:hypothetical protein
MGFLVFTRIVAFGFRVFCIMENSPDLGKGIFSKLKNSLVLRLGQIFSTNNSMPKVQPSYKALVLGLGWAGSYLFLRMVPSSYLLSVFEFWCSQNVLIKFPKHSHQVPLTSNGFSKFQKCSQYQQ